MRSDPADWAVVDGHLRAREFQLDLRRREHQQAARAARLIRRLHPSVTAVYLCGSCLDDGSTPADIDLLVVARSPDRCGPLEAALPPLLERVRGGRDGPTWDVTVVDRGAAEASRSILLMVATGSLLLAGEPLATPSFPADRSTAALLVGPRSEHVRVLLALLARALLDPSAPRDLVVRKLQKHALRLGALASLAETGCFSLKPERCAALIGAVAPALGPLAEAVAQDHGAGDRGLLAADRAVDLASAVLGGPILDRVHCGSA